MNRKKKQNPVNCQQKKQEEAAKRNAFFRCMKEIMAKCGCEEAYALVPESYKVAIYKAKISSLKVSRGNCGCLSDETFNQIAAHLDQECQMIKIPVGHSATEMTLKHFFTLGMSIILLQRWAESASFANAKLISDLILEKMDLGKAEEFAHKQAVHMSIFVGVVFSDIKKQLTWIKIRFETKDLEALTRGLRFAVTTHPAQTRMFVIDGHARPAYRVGSMVQLESEPWAAVKRSLFEKHPHAGDGLIPVYIQSHALLRLNERLDSFERNWPETYLYVSFEKPKVIWFKGRYLVEYRCEKAKLGYLVSEVVDGTLLVKTFLLVTNDGTPEGEKLKVLSGLTKFDMQYWVIDRLSTFQQSDIKENEELKDLFAKAGCQDLFKPSPFSDQNQDKMISLANSLLNYMHVEQEAEEQAALLTE